MAAVMLTLEQVKSVRALRNVTLTMPGERNVTLTMPGDGLVLACKGVGLWLQIRVGALL